MTKNEISLKDALLEGYITPTSMYDGIYTKTTQFMLPSISVNIKNKIVFKFFVNSYINDVKHEHEYERPIFVLFSVKDFKDKDWEKVYSALILSPNYITDYDCGKQDEDNLVMIVFRVPDEYARDYYLFKKGKYSQFSQQYKEKFPRFVATDDNKNEPKESIMWQVINKSDLLKEELAKEFTAKNDNGQYFKQDDYDQMLATFNEMDEIWDIPRKEREYYRYEKIIATE